MAQVPSALHALLGASVTHVDAAGLQRLIGFEESQWIEFKRELGDDKVSRHEFALDVTSFANAGGGLLAVGVDEDGATGAAAAIPGITAAGDQALRIEQVLGSKVQPPLPVTVHRVPLDDEREVLLVAVDAGPLAPHAVTSGSSKLSYPVRRGREKSYLSEAQVSDAYARRFASAEQRDAELLRLHDMHAKRLPTKLQSWVVLSLLPSGLGTRSLEPTTRDEFQEWLTVAPNWPRIAHGHPDPWNVRIAHRGVKIADEFDNPRQTGILRMDGAGTAARSWLLHWQLPSGELTDPSPRAEPIGGRETTWFLLEVTGLLSLLATHARRAGAYGTADAAIQIVSAEEACTQVSAPGRSARDLIVNGWLGEHWGSTELSRRTVDLGPLPENGSALLQAAYLLTLDAVSHFGLSDLAVVTETGEVIADRASALAPQLLPWASRWGASVLDTSD